MFRFLIKVSLMSTYVAIEDYQPRNHDALHLKKGDIVEILECTQSDKWLVRSLSNIAQIGFVAPDVLQKWWVFPL